MERPLITSRIKKNIFNPPPLVFIKKERPFITSHKKVNLKPPSPLKKEHPLIMLRKKVHDVINGRSLSKKACVTSPKSMTLRNKRVAKLIGSATKSRKNIRFN